MGFCIPDSELRILATEVCMCESGIQALLVPRRCQSPFSLDTLRAYAFLLCCFYPTACKSRIQAPLPRCQSLFLRYPITVATRYTRRHLCKAGTDHHEMPQKWVQAPLPRCQSPFLLASVPALPPPPMLPSPSPPATPAATFESGYRHQCTVASPRFLVITRISHRLAPATY